MRSAPEAKAVFRLEIILAIQKEKTYYGVMVTGCIGAIFGLPKKEKRITVCYR